MSLSPCRVLFRAAAGPRLGFGHLVRCRSLARALGIDARVSIRGTTATRALAARAGWSVATIDSEPAFRRARPDVLIVDDPSKAAARVWVRMARRHGVRVATVHDLGLGYVESDLAIDGSIEADGRPRLGDLRGPGCAILDPAIVKMRRRRVEASPERILIALGGGSQGRGLAEALSDALAERTGGRRIRVAAGFTSGRRRAPSSGEWIAAPGGLAPELAAASLAIVAGGVTLYEACALGVPAVAVALSPAQHVTIRAFAARGAAIDGGLLLNERRTVDRVVGDVAGLLRSRGSRRRLSEAGQHLVDGRGAFRVRDAVRQLCAPSSRGVTGAA